MVDNNAARLHLHEVLHILGDAKCRVHGSLEAEAFFPAPLLGGGAGGFSFHDAVRLPDISRVLSESKSTIILTNFAGPLPPVSGKAVVVVDDSRTCFIKVLDIVFRRSPPPAGIPSSTVVHPQAAIHCSASIGRHGAIGCCVIGEQVVIEHSVIIGDGVVIGRRVRIKSGAVIGNDGFSFARDVDGHRTRFIHYGGVVIEDDVEIGSNATIDRGTFGNTIVGEDSKIDNLCHVAHNVRIGRCCALAAGAILGGSDILGDRVYLGPGVVVKDGVTIGDDAFIGMGAVVIRNVKDRERVFGNPALPIP